MNGFLTQAQVVFLAVQSAWPMVVIILTALGTILSTLATMATNHPTVSTWLHRVITALSFMQHADVGGWKWPLAKARGPAPKLAIPLAQGFASPLLLVILAALTAVLASCAAVPTWSASPSFSAGPSIPLTVLTPGQPTPVQLVPGAGIEFAAGFAPVAIAGTQFDLLTGSVQAYGLLAAQSGSTIGGVAVAPMVGTLNNLIAAGPFIPLYQTDGTGCATKNCEVGVALAVSFPFDIATTPPVGTAQGVRALKRGGWSDLILGAFGSGSRK